MPNYAGCDYFRVTHPDERVYGEWVDLLMHEYMEEEKAGRRPHWRWLLGYYGRVGEHCFVGRGEQGALAHVSGSLANKLFYSLSREGARATRVDLQITAVPPTDPNDYLNEAYIYACAKEHTRGRPSLVQLNDTNYGAKMVTIGSRQSEVYGRIYDKFKESKEPAYKGMVRLEIEVKGQEAKDLHNFLMQDRLMVFHAKHLTTEWFRKRGVPVYWDKEEAEQLPEVQKRSKSDDTKLAWLATQVSPTVRTLVQHGKAVEAARALLTGCEDDEIIKAVAVWLAKWA